MKFKSSTFLLAVATVIISLGLQALDNEVKIPTDKSDFHIFILMGQSNMAGSSTPVPSCYFIKNPKILSLGQDAKWSFATVPLISSRGTGLSPGHVFAYHYSKLYPDVTVGVVLCAKGGRSLRELSKGSKDMQGEPVYDQSMDRIREILKSGTVKGVLWHQGEADATDTNYPQRLKIFVDGLRKDIGDENIPFIAGELGRFAPWTSSFNSNIPKIKTLIPKCSLASSEGLADKGDKVHFSGFSAEILGCRYLLEYLKMTDPGKVSEFSLKMEKITREMYAKDADFKIIVNGSMTEGETMPMGWESQWTSKGKLTVSRDTAEFAKGPASLRIESVGGEAEGSVSQMIKNSTCKRLKISGTLKNSGFTKCAIAAAGRDSSWKNVFWKSLVTANASGDWTPFTAELAVPDKAVNTSIQLFVSGEGKAWLDEISIEDMGGSAEPTSQASPTGGEFIRNGSMTAGNEIPEEWGNKWCSSGKMKVLRDTEIFKNGPSSLCLAPEGDCSGAVSYKLEGCAGKNLCIKGFVKNSKENRKCVVALAAFDSSNKSVKWENLCVPPDNSDTDWTFFEKNVTVPANANRANIQLLIEGSGKAWLDEVSCVEKQ